MTNEQLKELEKKLWDSANSLRAYGGIKAADYALPVLGLIFLKFADNKYSQFEPEIIKEFEAHKGKRTEQTIESIAAIKCGFYLPKKSRYDYLLHLSDDKGMANALIEAMKGIEDQDKVKFGGILPKDAYFDIEKKPENKRILPDLLRTFNDIPKDATGDIFGKIYEYFLGEFAMSEGQKGGEFFTPTSVVRFIVEVIEPYKGKIYDPACGSGGMFVQSAKFVKEANHDVNDIYVYGQEYMEATARLAKMNLMVNNIRGEIKEVNSYQDDPYKSLGKFDFVMANPPFNVKSVKESTVKNDERFYKYGLPKNKGKNTDDSITDANYLWISFFATSLNDKGRAGFVMANSASDAGNSEYDIRQKIVDSGIVDCMVSMPSNMFFTVTLPATLWFFDKQKAKGNRKDKILFIDARNTYNQINRAQREWKEEQIQNLTAIVRLYRGENERYLELVTGYGKKADDSIKKLQTSFDGLYKKLQKSLLNLKLYSIENVTKSPIELDKSKREKLELVVLLNEFSISKLALPKFSWNKEIPKANKQLLAFGKTLTEYVTALKELDANLKTNKDTISELWSLADKVLKLKGDKTWTDLELNNLTKVLDELQQNWKSIMDEVLYWQTNIHWLQSRFPDAKYVDVIGLCKVADKKEYAVEQDYSLNAGRYVGVEIEGDDMTKEEFNSLLKKQSLEFEKLTLASTTIEKNILSNLKELVREKF